MKTPKEKPYLTQIYKAAHNMNIEDFVQWVEDSEPKLTEQSDKALLPTDEEVITKAKFIRAEMFKTKGYGKEFTDEDIEFALIFIAKWVRGNYPQANKSEWISVDEKLPDDLSYHIVSWKLPSPDGDSFVYGTRTAMCEIYKDKKWYGENGIYGMNPLGVITHWRRLPEPIRENNL